MYGDITLYNFYTNEYSYLPHNIQMSEYSTPSFRQNKNMETLPKTCGPNPWDLFTVWFPVIQSTETLRYGYTITAKVA
jgi:hypothetical protein